MSENIGATLGGLLSMPIMVVTSINSGSVKKTGIQGLEKQYNILLMQRKSSRIGLVAALRAGAIMLINSITSSNAETNMELLGPGLIAATGAGIGAALSTTLVEELFLQIWKMLQLNNQISKDRRYSYFLLYRYPSVVTPTFYYANYLKCSYSCDWNDITH